MINADSLEVEVSSIGVIEGEVSSVNCIEGELNNTSYIPLITLQDKNVTPSTSSQTVKADQGYDGLSKVVVGAVTNTIDSDIKASNIKKGVNILGVEGTLKEYVEPSLQSKSVTPKTTAQTITPDSSYDGLSSVSVGAVTKSIDSNIQAANIKKGVSILGVNGSLEVGIIPSGTLNITTNGTHDVTNYASAEVNIAGDATIEDSIVTRTITTYTNDRITVIGNQAFRGTGLTSLNCPNVTSIEAYGLDSCSSLVDVNLPKVTSLKNYAMQGCKKLERLEFPEKITTQGAVWNNCSSLATLILRGTQMSGLGNKNCLTNTPIASGTGYIYVPDNLVDTYKANTNWSNYASQIKGLSELE